MRKISLLIFLSALAFSCSSSDDSENDPTDDGTGGTTDPTPTLAEMREETTTVITAGTSKTWRIGEATLSNGDVEIDISNSFNVVDDEFVFSGTGDNGNLEWRKGYEIQTSATTLQETLLDQYVSPVTTTFSYQADSSTVVEADFGTCVFTVNADGTISARITNADNSIYDFELTEKTASDFVAPPETDLQFSQAFTFESGSVACCSPGMIGSYSDNTFFLVLRETLVGQESTAERVYKFDLETQEVFENLFFQPDFVSKQTHIINNTLVVVGGQYVNTYSLDLGDPISTAAHGKELSRFGVAVLDNDIYIIGGDLEEVEGDKIFKWNLETQTLSEFATLPEQRSGARGTIVGDYMYVFGGTEVFLGDAPSDAIYKISMADPTQIETFSMGRGVDFTFVQKFQNLIYVAGRIEVRNADGELEGRTSMVGVFNTLDNSFRELSTNLVNSTGFDTIHQMCLFNGRMYLIYGHSDGESDDNGFPIQEEWEVLACDLE